MIEDIDLFLLGFIIFTFCFLIFSMSLPLIEDWLKNRKK